MISGQLKIGVLQRPMLAAMQDDPIVWIVFVVLLAGGSYWTYLAAVRRRSAWKRFARHHRLTYQPRQGQPRVFGETDGRTFELHFDRQSSDGGLLGIQLERMQLSINTGVPYDFDVTNEGVLLTALREATGDEDVQHLDDSKFGSETCVNTAHADQVREYLTEVRRRAILTLIDQCPACEVHVTQAEIRVEERTSGKTTAELTTRLAAMQAAAKILDHR